ncbi:hypothetical protein K2X30_07410 [bacterium]|jgi:hypothetical protein|nr:hypothetical protein [bacterium]
MKIDPKEVKKDLSHTSIDVLKDRATLFLQSKGFGKNIWFPDHTELYSKIPPQEEMDVVLFGNFALRFFESGNWPTGSYRLWVLSKAAKQVATGLLGIPKNQIGVIPRQALFPFAQMFSSFPKRSDPTTWVYAGRISATKNLEALLRTAHFLQTDYDMPLTLELYGSPDDQVHPDRGRREYTNRTVSLAQSLKWRVQPRFVEKLPMRDWLTIAGFSPVFCSFSTFICEDYGVSLAQAQSEGWPAIVSDWGGHSDASNSSLLKIHPQQIAHSHEPEAVQKLKAKALAFYLYQKLAQVESVALASDDSFEVPSLINSLEIDILRRKLIAGIGPHSQMILREGLSSFADTAAGGKFFGKYRLLFGTPSQEKSVVVLINDLHESFDQELNKISNRCEEILEEYQKAGKPVIFVSVREANSPECFDEILRAEKVILPFKAPELQAIQDWLSEVRPDAF